MYIYASKIESMSNTVTSCDIQRHIENTCYVKTLTTSIRTLSDSSESVKIQLSLERSQFGLAKVSIHNESKRMRSEVKLGNVVRLLGAQAPES